MGQVGQCCLSRHPEELEHRDHHDIWYDFECESEASSVTTASHIQAGDAWHDIIDDAPTIADVLRAGVPAEYSEGVALLGCLVSARGVEPCCDPLTLLRFLLSCRCNVERAAAMYRKTVQWRSDFSLGLVMAMHGAGETYDADGSPLHSNGESEWRWERGEPTFEAGVIQRHMFLGRLKQLNPLEGGPILVWRPGTADVAALRDDGDVMEVAKRGLAAHLEDCFQVSRAASLRQRKLVRSRLVIDARGLGLVYMRNVKTIQELVEFSTQYPEAVTSVTVVRAPWLAAQLWRLSRVFMPKDLASKFLILGTDFAAGLKLHSGLDVELLPEFLGGRSSDDAICSCDKVPPGVGLALREEWRICKKLGMEALQRVEKLKL